MLPPLRRAWLLDAQGAYLIQLQQELITFNWRKGDSTDTYPRFPKIYAEFVDILSHFEKAVEEEGGGKVTYQQYQLSYVNMIDEASGLGEIKAHQAVNGPSIISDKSELSEPEAINWTTTYVLSKNSGRISWAAQLALIPPKMSKALRLEIGAAGIPSPVNSESRDAWFQEAHDLICESFVGSTNPKLHAIWGKA